MNKQCSVHIIGLLIGLVLLGYFLSTLNWRAFFQALRGIFAIPLIGAVGLILLSTIWRALRWELLLRPNLPPDTKITGLARWVRIWHALCVGYFGNFVFPARAGELIRMIQIHKTLGIPFGAVVAISVLDRLLDICCVLSLGGILAFTLLTDMAPLSGALVPTAFAVVLVGLILAILVLWPTQLKRLVLFMVSPLPASLYKKLETGVEQMLIAVRQIGSPSTLVRAFLFSIAAFATDVALCWQLFTAFGWEMPLKAAIAMELSLCVAASLPAAPAYLGLYQAAAFFVLTHFGKTQEDGIAYALVLQLISLLTFSLAGGSGFFAYRKKRTPSPDTSTNRSPH